MTGNDGTYVGFYADIRSAGVLGTATELSVVPEPSALALGAVAAGAGLFCVRRRRARGFSGSGA